MTAKIYLTTVLSILYFITFGQNISQNEATGLLTADDHNEHPESQCAHAEIHEQRLLEDPTYLQEQLVREASLDNLVEQYQLGLIPKVEEIYTIPVVVHVIHDGDAYGTGSNISDEQIYSGINALNQDFRKMAGTLGDGDGEDIEVEFCLAQQSPSGESHTGINRVNGCTVTDYCTEGITAGQGEGANEVTVKNLSRWPNQDYYNIWVVTEIENNNSGSGIQGYAYFPTTSQVDGTVLLYNAFGTEGNLKSYTNKNKTLTHEMGHAFALYHTFQGATCTESNCTLQGDRVCDTPPTTLNSNCSAPACGGTQQVENYMDYTSQNCKNMFSLGQKTRMRLAIQNSRSNLMNSDKCAPVSTVLADGAITDIISPEGNYCSNMITPVVELTNAGSSPLSTAVIQYRTSGAWQNYNWTGLLGADQSTFITLPTFNGGWGMQTIEVKSTSPNGNADSDPANNLMSKNYNAVQNGHEVNVAITLDLLGGQTTWQLRNSADEVIASGGPYSNFQTGTVENATICVDSGCYDFIIMDTAGNGICCANGDGAYILTDENGVELASGGSFTNQQTTNFCLNAGGTGPTAQFSAGSVNLCQGGSTTFSNLSTGDGNTYEWKFFGATPFTVNGSNPGTITYANAGVFNVRLAATNDFGTDINLKNNYITVAAAQTWYEDADGDNHGNPNSTTQACTQPTGYVALGDDCDDSNGSTWNGCYDCAGVMNGTAVADNCGTCDSNPNNDCVQDCAGIWGGNAVMDNCGVCDTNPNNNCVQDCAGTWGGDALLDNCGVCDVNPANDCVQDCAGTWGGTASVDNCGTCDTNANNDCVQDCAGVWGGTAYIDNCGTCDSNATNDCVQDCAGTWGGDAMMDNCGVCDVNPANDCVQDCAGTWGGMAVIDNCETCDTNPDNDCVQDCAGVWGGSAYVDNCGICDDNAANDCMQDCAGVWGGDAVYDGCGTCDNNPDNDCIPCESLVVSVLSVDNSTCFGNADGAIALGIESETGMYTVLWSNGATSETIDELTAGNYQVTITEDSCTVFLEINITQPPLLSLTVANILNQGCEPEDLGSTLLQISGGSAPYSILLNGNAISDLQLSELEAGLYTVEVTDANGCIAGKTFEIGQDTCGELLATQVEDSICELGIVTFFEPVNCIPVAQAQSYAWELTNLSVSNPNITFTTTEPFFLSNGVTDLIPGDLYAVKVKGQHPELPATFGTACELYFEIELAKLVAQDCDNMGLQISDVISSTIIQGASHYEFRFQDAISFETFYHTSEIENTCALLDVNGLQTGREYYVDVRGKYRGSWSAYGEICSITIQANYLTTSLTEEWCENYFIDPEYDLILTQPIENATVYQIRLIGENDVEHQAESDLPQFAALQFDNLNPSTYYTAQTRAYVNGTWTEWGAECQVAFVNPAALKLNMFLFPNPTLSGNKVSLRMKGDWINVQIEVSNQVGVGLLKGNSNFQNMKPRTFNVSRLEPGLYFINVRHGRQTLTKKLIVE